MKRSKLNRWLVDLRSGKYSQAEGYLLSKDKTKACCLGVYLDGNGPAPDTCKLIPRKDNDVEGWAWVEHYANCEEANVSTLPRAVVAEDGWRSNAGVVYPAFETSRGTMSCLTEANDMGVSFEEIADIVEANPLWFFKTIEEDVQSH